MTMVAELMLAVLVMGAGQEIDDDLKTETMTERVYRLEKERARERSYDARYRVPGCDPETAAQLNKPTRTSSIAAVDLPDYLDFAMPHLKLRYEGDNPHIELMPLFKNPTGDMIVRVTWTARLYDAASAEIRTIDGVSRGAIAACSIELPRFSYRYYEREPDQRGVFQDFAQLIKGYSGYLRVDVSEIYLASRQVIKVGPPKSDKDAFYFHYRFAGDIEERAAGNVYGENRRARD